MVSRCFFIGFLFINLCFCCPISAQTIPANRRVDWSYSGIDMPFLLPNTIFSVSTYGALGNGITDDKQAIQTTIQAASDAGGGIVFFPAGIYILESAISIPNNVTLRGVSSTVSQLRFILSNSGSNCINISGTTSGIYRTVLSGYTLGSTTLTVSDTTGLFAGGFIELVQDNNTTWDTQPVSWANDSKGQMLRIKAVHENMIDLVQPLRINYEGDYNVRLRPINPVHDISIECLGIERTSDATGSGGGSNIAIIYGLNCKIVGVHSNKSVGAHFFIYQSSDIEVSGCYIHDAFTYDGTSTRGYGVLLGAHSGQCLIVNNIFKHLRHAMSIKQGANGNVLAYNYAFDGYRSEFPNDFASDISLHGHYAYANLFEGNFCELFWIDDAWGPSGPYNTAFRNRFSRHGIYMTSNGSNSQNIVGNEVTSTTLFQGFYVLSGTDHFTHGNNIKGTINPSGTNSLPDISYFFTQTPSFWNISAPFPPIGIPNTINSQSIPAKERYTAGNYTLCPTSAAPIRVKAHILLQGPYNSNNIGQMYANLRQQNLIPAAQPFDIAPINYKGSEIVYNLSEIPINAVDWILVELRQNDNPSVVIAQRAGFLLSDGTICDIRGDISNGIAFPQLTALSGNYYVAIRSRNHLPLISAQPVSLPNITPIDFALPSQVMGEASQLALHTDNTYLVPAGDCLPNGVITYTDLNMLQTGLPSSWPSYHLADCTMDGQIDSADHNLLFDNVSRIGQFVLR